MEMTEDEKLKLRNSPALFEFYRSLTGLHVVLVQYVQKGEPLKEIEACEETSNDIEAYSETSKDLEARAAEAAKACQALIRQFAGGCTPPATWDPSTGTCGS